jgi:hypothetical protein
VTHVAQNVSGHQITLSNTTVRQIPMFGWMIIEKPSAQFLNLIVMSH